VHVARLVPSGALALALDDALRGSIDWLAVAILGAWAAVGGFLASRLFRFV
jgi:ABC-2 type transport system permease protein